MLPGVATFKAWRDCVMDACNVALDVGLARFVVIQNFFLERAEWDWSVFGVLKGSALEFGDAVDQERYADAHCVDGARAARDVAFVGGLHGCKM